MKKPSLLIIVIIVSFILGSCENSSKTRYEAEFLFLFDTATTVIGYSRNEETFKEEAQFVYDELNEYHQLYDIYNEYEDLNNIKTINQNAGIAPVAVDSRIIDMLVFAKEVYTITQGKVNIAFGAVLGIWHTYRTDGIENPLSATLPSAKSLQLAADHTNIEDLVINKEAGTVFLKDKEMSLDVGSIAKGYAVEQVVQAAKAKGYTELLISVGGNIRTIGGKGNDQIPWEIGIQNPDKDNIDKILMHVKLSNGALVTSGDYLRYYTVEGIEYHHIIDPVTLFPSQYFDSVTIISTDAGLADALSTAAFNMPFDEGYAMIEQIESTEALWIFADGNLEESSGFVNLVEMK